MAAEHLNRQLFFGGDDDHDDFSSSLIEGPATAASTAAPQFYSADGQRLFGDDGQMLTFNSDSDFDDDENDDNMFVERKERVASVPGGALPATTDKNLFGLVSTFLSGDDMKNLSRVSKPHHSLSDQLFSKFGRGWRTSFNGLKQLAEKGTLKEIAFYVRNFSDNDDKITHMLWSVAMLRNDWSDDELFAVHQLLWKRPTSRDDEETWMGSVSNIMYEAVVGSRDDNSRTIMRLIDFLFEVVVSSQALRKQFWENVGSTLSMIAVEAAAETRPHALGFLFSYLIQHQGFAFEDLWTEHPGLHGNIFTRASLFANVSFLKAIRAAWPNVRTLGNIEAADYLRTTTFRAAEDRERSVIIEIMENVSRMLTRNGLSTRDISGARFLRELRTQWGALERFSPNRWDNIDWNTDDQQDEHPLVNAAAAGNVRILQELRQHWGFTAENARNAPVLTVAVKYEELEVLAELHDNWGFGHDDVLQYLHTATERLNAGMLRHFRNQWQATPQDMQVALDDVIAADAYWMGPQSAEVARELREHWGIGRDFAFVEWLFNLENDDTTEQQKLEWLRELRQHWGFTIDHFNVINMTRAHPSMTEAIVAEIESWIEPNGSNWLGPVPVPLPDQAAFAPDLHNYDDDMDDDMDMLPGAAMLPPPPLDGDDSDSEDSWMFEAADL